MSIDNRTHIIHDRNRGNSRERTIGYRISKGTSDGILRVSVARAICSKKDNFNKKVARSIVNSRLDSVDQALFTANQGQIYIAAEIPKTCTDWRTFEQTVMSLSDMQIPAGRPQSRV